MQVPKALPPQTSPLARFGEEATSGLTNIGVFSSAPSGSGRTRRLFSVDWAVIDPPTLHFLENSGAVLAVWGTVFTFLDRPKDVAEFDKRMRYLYKVAYPDRPYPPVRTKKDRKILRGASPLPSLFSLFQF